MGIKTVDSSEIRTLFGGDTPVVVDFSADWCAPCRALAPEIETLASAFSGDVEIVKLDVDTDPEFAREHGVMSVPTVIHFSADGEEIARSIGLRNAAQLASELQLGAPLTGEGSA